MADDPKQNLFPSSLAQNPAPVNGDSQDRKAKVSAQVEEILAVFMQLVPSNYVSTVKGPHYLLRFQAAAEQIAEFQITAQESFADTVYEFTRSEFLFQILGTLVFPDANSDGIPTIPGDISYRTFLRRMVELLLQGATKANMESGLALLTDSDVEVIEKAIVARQLGDISGWGDDDAFTFEVNVSRFVGLTDDDDGAPLYGFPLEGPFTLQENVRVVLRALKPAHVLYDYRHLFQDTFGSLFTGEVSWSMSSYYYDDMRKYCLGAKQVTGTAGETWTDRSLFSDPARSFVSIKAGAELAVLSGGNLGTYRVRDVLHFPVGDDATARAYTTSSGLSGTVTVSGSDLEDPAQDFGLALEGEILTILAGPNAGAYRLNYLLGTYGGPVGYTTGPFGHSYTRVRIAPSLLRLEQRMPTAASGQSYVVTVDRLGVQVPREITGEDVSRFFVQ